MLPGISVLHGWVNCPVGPPPTSPLHSWFLALWNWLAQFEVWKLPKKNSDKLSHFLPYYPWELASKVTDLPSSCHVWKVCQLHIWVCLSRQASFQSRPHRLLQIARQPLSPCVSLLSYRHLLVLVQGTARHRFDPSISGSKLLLQSPLPHPSKTFWKGQA